MISIHRNTAYAQGANCWLLIHVGSTAIFIGKWLGGYGARLELFTPTRKFRVRLPRKDKHA